MPQTQIWWSLRWSEMVSDAYSVNSCDHPRLLQHPRLRENNLGCVGSLLVLLWTILRSCSLCSGNETAFGDSTIITFSRSALDATCGFRSHWPWRLALCHNFTSFLKSENHGIWTSNGCTQRLHLMCFAVNTTYRRQQFDILWSHLSKRGESGYLCCQFDSSETTDVSIRIHWKLTLLVTALSHPQTNSAYVYLHILTMRAKHWKQITYRVFLEKATKDKKNRFSMTHAPLSP